MAAVQPSVPQLQPSSQQVHLAAVTCFLQAACTTPSAAKGQVPSLLTLDITHPQDAGTETKGPGWLVAVQSEDTAFLIQCGTGEGDSRPVACLSSTPPAWLPGFEHLAHYIDLQTLPLPSTSKGVTHTVLADDHHAAGSSSTTTSAVTDAVPAPVHQPTRLAKGVLAQHDSANQVLHQVASTDETTVALAHLDPAAAKATSRLRPAGEQPGQHKTQLQSRAPHALQVRVKPAATAGMSDATDGSTAGKAAQGTLPSEPIRYGITLNTDHPATARSDSPVGVLGPFAMPALQVLDGRAPGSQGGATAPALDLAAPSPTMRAMHAAPALPTTGIRVVSLDHPQLTPTAIPQVAYNASPNGVVAYPGGPSNGDTGVVHMLQLAGGNTSMHALAMGVVEAPGAAATEVPIIKEESGLGIQADLVLQPGSNRATADQLPGGRGSASEGFPRKLVHRYNPNAPRDKIPVLPLEPRASTGTGSEDAGSGGHTQARSTGTKPGFYLSKGRPGSRAMRPQKYTGVYRQAGRFRAQFSHGGLVHQLGMYDNEESAAQAWDRVAWVYRGRQADLNFPEMVEQYDDEESKAKVHELMDERMAMKKPRGKAAIAAAAAAIAHAGRSGSAGREVLGTRGARLRRPIFTADSDSTDTLTDSDNDNENNASREGTPASDVPDQVEDAPPSDPAPRDQRRARSRATPAKRRISDPGARPTQTASEEPSAGAVLPDRAAALNAYTRYLAGLQPLRANNQEGVTSPRTRGGNARRVKASYGADMHDSDADEGAANERQLMAMGSVTAAGMLKCEDAPHMETAGPMRAKPAPRVGSSRANSREDESNVLGLYPRQGRRSARAHCTQARIDALSQQAAELLAGDDEEPAEADADGWNEQAAVHFLTNGAWQNQSAQPHAGMHQGENTLTVANPADGEEDEQPAMDTMAPMMMPQGGMMPGQHPMMWSHAQGMYAGMYPGMMPGAYMPGAYGSPSIMPGMMPPGMMPIMAQRPSKKSKHSNMRAFHMIPGSLPSMPPMAMPNPGATMPFAHGGYPAATHTGANAGPHGMYPAATHMYQMAMCPGYGAPYYPAPMYGVGMMGGAMQEDGEEDVGEGHEEGQGRERERARSHRKGRGANGVDKKPRCRGVAEQEYEDD